jgi:hypothetical protein
MDSELNVLCDRLEALESEIIEIKLQLHKSKIRHLENRVAFGLGLSALTVFLLLGLSIDSQFQNTRITYNNESELTRIVLTLFGTGAATWSLREKQKSGAVQDEFITEKLPRKSY